MKLKSKDFLDDGSIPSEFTCDGRNISPQLSWEGVPDGTKSFALGVMDPDAPKGTWIHWLVHNISSDQRELDRGSLPAGTEEVDNDFGRKLYGGPCPPSGTHRYFFTIYALDTKQLVGVNKHNFFDKVEKHTIEKATIKGLYKRL